MTDHYTEFRDNPKFNNVSKNELQPSVVVERNALYILLREHLTTEEITERLDLFYKGRYIADCKK
jgi:hypothetical protein